MIVEGKRENRLDVVGNRNVRCDIGCSNPFPNVILNFERYRVCDFLVFKRNDDEDQENAQMRIRKSSPRNALKLQRASPDPVY